METGALIFIAIWMAALLFLIQRTEKRRRRAVLFLVLIVGFLTQYWANFRGLGREFWFALLAAAIVNVLFWMFIGRYNPVGSSDDIQVIGMDD